MVKHWSVYALSVSFVGYAVLGVSAGAVTLLVGLTTGCHPCVTCFTLPLLTFRLSEIRWALVLFPPLAATCVMLLLSRTGVSRRVVAGLGLTSPYLLVALMYLVMGAGEFPLEIAIPWIVWAFLVGTAAAMAVDRLHSG